MQRRIFRKSWRKPRWVAWEAADRMQRHGIGIEIERKWVDLSIARGQHDRGLFAETVESAHKFAERT